ncbi:MAG: response regulator [Bacteroidia bacterium]|nr:response regulator [Bacteroidota bacterium]MBP9081825.1 response regulator [Bacteroidia bacterium]MBK7387777.1 response regulator [Bacteroidota bacterium]MBK7971157.1 response regulator [Bacteroidota bacterium]MBK8415525.1 response regulator [Bacteroidota bacterium]
MGKDIDAIIIDDELDICILLTGMLRQIGFKTRYATTLKEGLTKLSNSSNMVLFLDNNLPDGSGLEALSDIKKDYPDIRVIMISAYDGDAERRRAADNGAADFIGKPLKRSLIVDSLKNIFPDFIN